MKEKIIISFLILSYNNQDTISKAINSIIFSNIDTEDYEIIISDDGSNDNTKTIIKEYIELYPNIRLFFTDKNELNTRNQSIGRNIGISNARGKYIRFLDGDDYFNSIDLFNDYLYLSKVSADLVISNRITRRDNNIFKKDYSKKIFDGIGNYYVKNKLLVFNNIKYEENKYNWYSEDIYFFILIYEYANKIDFINNDFTYYCIKKPNSNSDLSIIKYNELIDLFDYYSEMKNDLLKLISKQSSIDILEDLILEHINTIISQISSGEFA